MHYIPLVNLIHRLCIKYKSGYFFINRSHHKLKQSIHWGINAIENILYLLRSNAYTINTSTLL